MANTLADLVEITRANRRSVQLWAEAEALLTIPRTHQAGTGKNRQFENDEIVVACLLAQFARQGVPISALKKIAREIRRVMKAPEVRAQIERAKADKGRNFLLANKVDGTGKMVFLSDSITPKVDIFDRLAGVITPTDDVVTLVINLNLAFLGFREPLPKTGSV